MADNNTRDVTPDDFNHPDNLDVPTYDAAADRPDIDELSGSEAATEVHIRAAEPAPAYETVALERESEYIPPAAPVEDTSYTEAPVEVQEETVVAAEPVRRGTIDFGLLLMRLALGAFLIIDSLAVFFRLGGNGGIAGLESAFADYTYGNALAIVVPTLELAAGVFLVLGLLTPVAAAVAIAVSGFMAVHALNISGIGFNVFAWGTDVWVPVMVLFAAIALQFTGPGLYGVDAQRGWARRPLASSWICFLVGLAAAGLMWWFGTGVNPFA